MKRDLKAIEASAMIREFTDKELSFLCSLLFMPEPTPENPNPRGLAVGVNDTETVAGLRAKLKAELTRRQN